MLIKLHLGAEILHVYEIQICHVYVRTRMYEYVHEHSLGQFKSIVLDLLFRIDLVYEEGEMLTHIPAINPNRVWGRGNFERP